MTQLSSSQAASSSQMTENPVVAVGRKVKSVLTTHQRPTIRIYRDSPSTGGSRHVPATRDLGGSSPSGPVPGGSHSQTQSRTGGLSNQSVAANQPLPSNGNTFTNHLRSWFGRDEFSTDDRETYEHEYDPDMVDLLDVMDPEVSTLSTLTNVQNSLFVPSLGRIVNRQPTYRLTERPGEVRTIDRLKAKLAAKLKQIRSPEKEIDKGGFQPKLEYAVLPDGERLEGWTHQDAQELDDAVRHQLHSKRAKFYRSLKGFRQYVRRPLGLFITVYATTITLFGAAWVLFLIGWISLGSQKAYIVNVVDNVLVALFAIIGDGLAPFRLVDTYHMAYIAHYHRKTWKIRAKEGLPELWDHNDLPDQRKEDLPQPAELDLESLVARRMPRGLARRIAPMIPKRYADGMLARNKEVTVEQNHDYSVLTPEEQAKLEYHERKFSKSHTFYKPHETETHYAFPLKLLFTVVILLDLHSCLQISLGACTWGIPYKHRPFALTTVILCCSITCNIMGGVLISMGDKRTRKHDVIERMMKQELTQEAIDEINARKVKDAEEKGISNPNLDEWKKKEEEKEAAENEEIKKSWKSVPTLPKKLLGKGKEDHRQPSLPQSARGSNANVAERANSQVGEKMRKDGRRGTGTIRAVKEDESSAQQLSYPQSVVRKGEVASGPKKGVGQRVLEGFRKADGDKS